MTKPKPPKEAWIYVTGDGEAWCLSSRTAPHEYGTGAVVVRYILAPAKPKRSKRGGKKA
jgi:hypothetical protein